eukprot:CAMPEP_0185831000 /NCGR_PEP_ID=MMETSP1353-20130828/1220_1 /TAXON_ID=1077150 /ORGANISM="Erythrolobus australicus, Strain CCMP3124" /LENGTH=425 /DNA_ID=CAMNT_0028529009 /DNA_START=249 /DNA_END=1526 /DNA_ORIENTATION=+
MGGCEDVLIVSAKRTAFGCFGGQHAALSAIELGALAIRGALEHPALHSAIVDECILGMVYTAGVGQAPARSPALLGALPSSTRCTSVNKVCASGAKAITLAAQSIMLHDAQVTLAGGMESMSNVPHYLRRTFGARKPGNIELEDGLLADGLLDALTTKSDADKTRVHMGEFAERTAQKYGISREEQDNYARESYELAIAAQNSGAFKDELVPESVFAHLTALGKCAGEKKAMKEALVRMSNACNPCDEQPSRFQPEKMSALKAAFIPEGGTITAANASAVADGAAAVVLMSAEMAAKHNVRALARLRAYADAELPPEQFGEAPAIAMRTALARAKLDVKDIDLWEVHEAFAVVAIANAMRELNVERDKLNVHGGAISLGHPLGASGARIVVALVHALRRRSKRLGVAAICNGGGGATALIIEALP